MSSAGAPPSSPDPRFLRVVIVPSHPVAMPSLPLPPAPPAAAHGKRPSPLLKKMRLLFPYAAVSRAFRRCKNRAWGMAMNGLQKMMLPLPCAVNRVERAWGMATNGLHIVVMPLSIWLFNSVPEEVRFWMCLYFCLAAAMAVITFVDIYDQQPQQLAPAAAVLLPPPPPEMDMC